MNRRVQKPPKKSVIDLPGVDEPNDVGILTAAKMKLFEDALTENGVTDPIAVGIAKAEYLIGDDVDAFLQYEFEKKFAAFVLDPADPDRARLHWHVPTDLGLSQERMMRVPGVADYVREIGGRYLHAAKAGVSAETWFAGKHIGGYSYFAPGSKAELRAQRKETLNMLHAGESARVYDGHPTGLMQPRPFPTRLARYVMQSTSLDAR